MLTSHKLKSYEPLSEDIKRIALAINKLAAAIIEKGIDADPHGVVHELRKRLKELRAILRLIRGQLGQEYYTQENSFYRDLGKEISDIRDFQAFLESLNRLGERYEGKLYKNAFTKTGAFIKERQQSLEKEIDLKETLLTIKDELDGHQDVIRNWDLEIKSFKAVTGNIKKIYAEGHGLLQKLDKSPTTVMFHEWRKQSKYLAYQLFILTPIWPEIIRAFEREFQKLADLTGEDHDMAEFMSFLNKHVPDADEFELLKAIINDQRKSKQKESLLLGRRLYTETPGRFISRINSYWLAYEHTYPALDKIPH